MHSLKIKNLRIDHDYSQQYIADMLSINRRTYSNYENMITEIPYKYLFQIAKLYNVSIEYLLGLTKKDKPIIEFKNYSYNKLLKNLVTLREKHNYTQENISKIIICNYNSFSQYETGKRKIPIDVLIKLSRIYNTQIDFLFI